MNLRLPLLRPYLISGLLLFFCLIVYLSLSRRGEPKTEDLAEEPVERLEFEERGSLDRIQPEPSEGSELAQTSYESSLGDRQSRRVEIIYSPGLPHPLRKELAVQL